MLSTISLDTSIKKLVKPTAQIFRAVAESSPDLLFLQLSLSYFPPCFNSSL